jgi:hypothetical protein
MRELTFDEMDMVSGGAGMPQADGGQIDEVVVTAKKKQVTYVIPFNIIATTDIYVPIGGVSGEVTTTYQKGDTVTSDDKNGNGIPDAVDAMFKKSNVYDARSGEKLNSVPKSLR